MPCSSKQVEVGASETLVINAEKSNGCRLIINNMGQNSAFLGGADVMAASGYELEKKERLELVLNPGDALYAITEEEGTTKLHILRI